MDHNTGQPTVVRATSVQEFQLCDGNPHSVSFTVTDTYIEISVDEEISDRTTFQARQSVAFSGPLYLGGIPGNSVTSHTMVDNGLGSVVAS